MARKQTTASQRGLYATAHQLPCSSLIAQEGYGISMAGNAGASFLTAREALQ